MIKSSIRRLLNSLGYDLASLKLSFTPEELALMRRVKGFTMTSPERLAGLKNAIHYLVENKIPGDLVECGVWRGGSMMAAAYTLLSRGDTTRNLHLFDTFAGMTPPTERDVVFNGATATELLQRAAKKEGETYWCIASMEDVARNLFSTGYPKERIFLWKGRVEETIPRHAPSQIALLRLDTDFYESTAHELLHLYPRLSENGVLIIDDYGHWQGAKQAVDEYFAKQPLRPLLNRLDYTGRLVIKPAASLR
jgi:hypothetical protein